MNKTRQTRMTASVAGDLIMAGRAIAVLLAAGTVLVAQSAPGDTQASEATGSMGKAAEGAAEMADVLSLRPHPRLWVNPDTVAHLSDKLHSTFLKTQAARVLADADWLLEAGQIAERQAPTYQQATRAIASRFQCLTAAWILTRDAKYRAAAIQTLANMMNWNLISCESRNDSPANRKEFFCLSYGEHAADIALMYDVFRPDITPEEQKVFFDVLDRFYLKKALESVARPPWWAFKGWSNWNGVCAGGMGMLALAFYDDRPEARALIPLRAAMHLPAHVPIAPEKRDPLQYFTTGQQLFAADYIPDDATIARSLWMDWNAVRMFAARQRTPSRRRGLSVSASTAQG